MSVYEDDTLSKSTYQNWFTKFCSTNVDNNDAPGFGFTHKKIETNNFKANVDKNPHDQCDRQLCSLMWNKLSAI